MHIHVRGLRAISLGAGLERLGGLRVALAHVFCGGRAGSWCPAQQKGSRARPGRSRRTLGDVNVRWHSSTPRALRPLYCGRGHICNAYHSARLVGSQVLLRAAPAQHRSGSRPLLFPSRGGVQVLYVAMYVHTDVTAMMMMMMMLLLLLMVL